LLILFEAVLIFIFTFLLSLEHKGISPFGYRSQPSERRIHKGLIPEAGGLSFALPIFLAQPAFTFLAAIPKLEKCC
jgi:UDP-N-acetylmuramyl pentapeptide phosphotransferase/UDP-N-acetylglucosamine-1-phosphate transferase